MGPKHLPSLQKIHVPKILLKFPVSKALDPQKTAKFGESFTPHVLHVDWSQTKGWSKPYFLRTAAQLTIPYSATGVHYALSCYEGLKAYTTPSGSIRLFRPSANAKRFQRSCGRLLFPKIRAADFVGLVRAAVRKGAAYVPKTAGAALYIRPFMFSTDASLRIGPTSKVKFCIMLSPVQGYYQRPKAGTGLLVEEKMVRAWPGGTGQYKLACNYAPTILALKQAHRSNCIQTLWLGPRGECTEAGSMNLFFVFRDKRGRHLVKTAPADELTLPGVTRSSVITILRRFKTQVKEETLLLRDVIKDIQSGRLVECFGCGTAATITPITFIRHGKKVYRIATHSCSIASRLLRDLEDIQYGRKESRWSVSV